MCVSPGLIIAVVASTRGGHETSACAWYFVAFTFDTTLGVGLAVLMHKLLVRAARAWLAAATADSVGTLRKRGWAATIASCGDYGAAPGLQSYGHPTLPEGGVPRTLRASLRLGAANRCSSQQSFRAKACRQCRHCSPDSATRDCYLPNIYDFVLPMSRRACHERCVVQGLRRVTGDPPSWQRWAVQMAEWVAATVIARAMCGVVVVGARRLLVGVARLLDGAFAGHPTAELFSVMLAGPLAMNLIQVRYQVHPFFM